MTNRRRWFFFPTLRIALAAGLLFAALAGTAVSGPFEDGVSAHTRGDFATALQLWRPLADQGNAPAQFNLGIAYQRGEGVPQDFEQALKWYRLSADQGYARAQFNLAVMYHRGEGVPQNFEQAATWYREAAERGEANAQFNLAGMFVNGRGVPKDYVQAAKWYDLAASHYTNAEEASRFKALRNRDHLAEKMTPAQIAEAQKEAREWKPK